MEISAFAAKLAAETEKIILGKHDRIELIIAALLAGGHILLDDLPGVGKTTLVKTLSLASGCASRRVQFVPDLLPSDITGMNIFDQRTGEFRLLRGPVFTHILLADEINRAVPRTQSALLEAMEEQHVTIDGETLPLPAPFFVLATQNPVESESTFRLPAAQMDRFLMRLSMGYPDAAEEAQMLRNLGDAMPFDQVRAVTGPEGILALRASLQNIQVSDAVTEYIVALVAATRGCPWRRHGCQPPRLSRTVPRSQSLGRHARARVRHAGRRAVPRPLCPAAPPAARKRGPARRTDGRDRGRGAARKRTRAARPERYLR